MPYKTKAAKIAAAQRRFSYIEAKKDGTFSYGKKAGKVEETALQHTKTIGDKLYLRGDLLKIIVTCSVIVAFQIWLSLTLF